MNSEYPTTQLHHTAICPQQPINWWKGQRVISYLTWRLLMCTEVKRLKWRQRESNELLLFVHTSLQTPVFCNKVDFKIIYLQVRFLKREKRSHSQVLLENNPQVFVFPRTSSIGFEFWVWSQKIKRSTASPVLRLEMAPGSISMSTSAVFKQEWFQTSKMKLIWLRVFMPT